MTSSSFERLAVYRLAERLSDMIWNVVKGWPALARDTIGRQNITAADSVGANIAEGVGRWSFKDNQRFVRIARGSLYETRHWLRRAYRRGLLDSAQVREIAPVVEALIPMLNAYVASIGRGMTVRDEAHSYMAGGHPVHLDAEVLIAPESVQAPEDYGELPFPMTSETAPSTSSDF